MNKHDGTELGSDDWKASTTASLLASSVCELSGCSLAAMNKVELTLKDIFSHIDPLFLDVIYHYVNQAFTENTDVPNNVWGKSAVECAIELHNNTEDINE